MIFDVFFSVNYWLMVNVYRNKEYPFFSTILTITLYEFFALLFILDFILFQVLDMRSVSVNRSKSFGFLAITIILIFNYYYYSRNNRYKEVLSDFKKLNKKSRNYAFIISILFMIVTVVLTVYLAYSLRNNISWF